MESLVELKLGDLLEDVGGDTDLLQELVIDEIERSLPEIISSLQLPPSIDAVAKQRIEFKLMGRKGFRHFQGRERENATEQLKQQSFSNALRGVQQIVSYGTGASPVGRSSLSKEVSSELTNQETIWFTEADTVLTDAISYRALTLTGNPPKTPQKLLSNSVHRHATLVGIRENAPAKTILTTRSHEVNILDIPNIPIELQEPIAGRDVRGLIALLRVGKLVAFLESSASDLVPRGIEKIRVPSPEGCDES